MASSKYRTRKRRSNSGISEDNLGRIIFFVLFVITCTGCYFYFSDQNERSKISKAPGKEYCRIGVLPEKTVIILDHSDTINAVQKGFLERELKDIASSVKQYGALSLFSVDSALSENLKPELTLCNPGDASTVSELNRNVKMTERNYNTKFRDVIDTKLSELMGEQSSQTSPIMKSIQVASSESFSGKDNAAEKKRLVIVSDFLENTPSFSFFRTPDPSFNSFLDSAYWDSIWSDLSDTEVIMLYLNRQGAQNIQTPKHKAFWQRFFKEQGASTVQFKKVPG